MSAAPKTPPRTQEPSILPGTLVIYENEAAPIVGAVTAGRKDKFLIFNDRGREIELPPNRLYVLPGKLPADAGSNEAREDYLRGLRDDAARFAATVDLEEIWLFLHEDGSEFTNEQLCILYYGTNDLVKHLGLRLALLSDSTYFKRGKETFIPRPEDVIEELKHARDVRDRKDQLRQLAVDFAGRRLLDKAAPVPSGVEPLINSVADLAALSPSLDHIHQREAMEFIEQASETHRISLNGQPERRAFDFLLAIGVFDRRTNPRIIRHKPPIAFSGEALAEAESVRIPERVDEYSAPGLVPRHDFSSIRSFTVDDVSTRDMDDALSIVQRPDGYTLYIHVSEVASFLQKGSILDLEARKRATSLYLPERKLNMLPPALSENSFSLVEGRLRPVLTCAFEIDRNYEVLDSRIMAGLVRIQQRYNYEEIDEALLTGDREFDILHQIASSREMHRIANDGFKVHKRDVSIHVDDSGTITLSDFDEHSPARSLVGEMMILANECIARFCLGHDLPVPYRGQEPSDPDDGALAKIPQGPAYDFAVKSRLKRSETSFSPIPHANLGLDAYTQATSPIRRYLDLCVQRQIVSQLKGDPPAYSLPEFEELNAVVQENLAVAHTVARESKRYWLYRYLEKMGKSGKTIGGTVVRTDLKNPLVELDVVYVTVPARISGNFSPGDHFQFRIVNVDALSDYVRLEAVL